MASAMDIDDEGSDLPTSSSGKGDKKRFEVKKVPSQTRLASDSVDSANSRSTLSHIQPSNLSFSRRFVIVDFVRVYARMTLLTSTH